MHTQLIDMQPPHNAEAEEAVLGSILIDPDALYDVTEVLAPEMFYRPAHQWLYEAINRLHGRGEPLDLLAIENELKTLGKLEAFGGLDYLFTLANAVITSVNASVYARLVADTAMRRRLITSAGKIAKAAYSDEIPAVDALAQAEAEILAVGTDTAGGSVLSPRRYMSTYIEAFMADVASDAPSRVVRTGLTDLDSLLGGMERGHQYLVAGATSMGKSSFALGVALHAALRQGKRVLVFSLEMSEEQLTNRFISMMTGIPVQRLKAHQRRHLSTEEQARVMQAGGQLSDSSLFMDCTPAIRPSDVHSRAAKVYAQHGLDLIIVDHMHIMRPNTATGHQVQDLGSIAMDLANVYKSLNVAGMTLAQLNRGVSARAIKVPTLADLRESGQIEENAYVIAFLYRPGYYEPETENPNVAKVVIAKNRDGATGQVDVFWDGARATFRDLVQVELNPPPRPGINGQHSANGRGAAKEPSVQGEIIGFA